MEWFKHKTGSLDDPDINTLMDEFGDAGYVMFFGLLEIYGREFKNINYDGFLWLSLKFVARKLRKSSAKTKKFLNYCETELKKRRFLVRYNKNKVGIKCEDFIDLASNWTKRVVNKPTAATTAATTAIKQEQEVETEEEQTNRADLPFHFSFHTGDYLDEILKLCEQIERLKKAIKKQIDFNQYRWVQTQTNESGHPLAIVDSLKAVIQYWATIDNPEGYAISIMKTISQNYHEADHLKQHQEFKKAFEVDPRVNKLIKGIGK